MKRFAILACVCTLMAVGSGCGSSPTTPTNQPTVYTVQLSALNETPPVTNEESTARGVAVITMKPTRDSSGTITGGTIDFSVSMNGLQSTTVITAAHIHPGAAGVPGGVLIGTGVTSADNIQVTNGNATFAKLDVDAKGSTTTAAQNMQAILANPAGYYFNVHTSRNGGGVMRGQLQ
jgi:CHRD domain